MIPRILAPHLERLSGQYPVVTVTGPRQSGKTTLVRSVFAGREYVTLEAPEVRRFASTDPRRFLAQFPDGAILDEVQRVPELFSYIQGLVDDSGRPGLFILTGSAQFELLESITQSLAGRTAMVRLLPFSMPELGAAAVALPLDEWLYRGAYPRIHDRDLDPTEALSFYVSTYVERDVRQLLNIRDLTTFDRFLRLCAARTGQVLNLSNLGNDCGINHNTAQSWISILEASYLIHRVAPHFANPSKRQIKAPKIYFCDVGLAAYLLGITSPAQVAAHPLRGALFETFVVSELLKQRYNAVRQSNLYYFRDRTGNEVDLVIDQGSKVTPVEIKSGATFADDMLKGLRYYQNLVGERAQNPTLFYGGSSSHDTASGHVRSYRDLAHPPESLL